MKITAIDYGKRAIPVYRFAATPLRGVTPVPESAFTGRENHLFAAEVNVQVLATTSRPRTPRATTGTSSPRTR